jgi:hypothetical protein
MSGHLLETMNPEAVDQIGLIPATQPDIGTRVVYIARPGEGRAGKMEFPAEVMHVEPHGGLYLLVIYAADDMVERPNVREASEESPFPAWRHLKGQEPEKFEPSRLNLMRKDVDWLRAGLDEMNRGLYGDWERPDGSMMDFLVRFEQLLGQFGERLKALEAK